MESIAPHVRSWLDSLQWIAIVYAGGMLLERLAPAERGQPLRRIGFNLLAGVVLFTISGVLVGLLYPLVAPAIDGPWGHLIRVELPDGIAGSVAQVLVFFLVYDFFYYWWHRAQHEFGWLWPQHELHHSDTAVNVTTSLRHHWLEDPLRVFTMMLPLGMLFYFKPASVAWVGTALGLWPFFIHLNVRLELGWLTRIVAGPQYHRIHHSLRPEHFNRNYAAFFPVWDIVFGTAWIPARGEFPPTGVARGEPRGLADALVGPFRDWRAMLSRRKVPG